MIINENNQKIIAEMQDTIDIYNYFYDNQRFDKFKDLELILCYGISSCPSINFRIGKDKTGKDMIELMIFENKEVRIETTFQYLMIHSFSYNIESLYDLTTHIINSLLFLIRLHSEEDPYVLIKEINKKQ